uniref:Beta-lactamase-like protein 2 homolog n=1 Tax=Xenopsylla cheopis TaxID=163159 RepID=A0A6M2DUH4_XENCH
MAAIIPPVTRISSKIIRVLGCNPGEMTLQGTNTYIIGTGSKRILIDTGDAGVEKYIQNLQGVMKENKFVFSDIILTHWHHDHIGGVESILNLEGNKGCRVWKHPRTDIVEDGTSYGNLYFMPLKNKQDINVEGATLEVYHTPGHTTDHVVLLLNEQQISKDKGTSKEQDDSVAVFSGDCILGEGTAVFEDLYDYMKSLYYILSLKPTIIYPGHGNIVQDPVERIEYYIQHRNERERQIMAYFESNPDKLLNTLDIVKNVYVGISESLWPAASVNVSQHLNKLRRENRVYEKVVKGEHLWSYRKESML